MTGILGGTIGSYSSAKPAPTYVGGTTASQTTAGSVSLTSLTGGSNSSPSSGDLVVVSLAVGFDTATTSPLGVTGYTTIQNLASNPAGANGDDLYHYTGYKRLITADTSLTTTGFNNLNGGAVAVHVWRGVSTTPMDVTATFTNDILGTFTDGPAITPVTQNAIILSIVALGSDTSGRTWSNANLSNLVSAPDVLAGQDAHTAIGSVLWTGGAYTPTGWSTNDTDSTSSGAAVTIALRPS